MGYKKVCIDCRMAFNQSLNLNETRVSTCPQCKKPVTELYHLFQPPKQSDKKKWEVVRFLVDRGFRYFHILNRNITDESGKAFGYQNYVPYPESMREAKEFVENYKEQARKA